MTRMDQEFEELRQFVAEQHALMAKDHKLTKPMRRSCGENLALILAAGLLAIMAGLTARLPEIMQAFGWLP